MAQAFAIASLHVRRSAPEVRDGKVVVPGKVEVVPAGAITDLSDEDFKIFEAAGAVRRPSKMDRAMAEGDDAPEAVETAVGRPVPAKQAR
ncbi:protein of unknown function [Methylorubrum extorquens]|uniref:Uncharacterized protein n=1 Tax=Methylorubrum extorquens TaxID=408 RepID=A0A2N9AHI5_METEX|nr:protein of unknown function [Methylorubrum extorquens]